MSYNIRKARFTVVELLVVIAVIGILAGITLGTMNFANKRKADARTTATIEMLKQGLEQYKAKYGFYLPSIPMDSDSTTYAKFRLDKVTLDAADGHSDNIKNNFCQFIDYQDLITQSDATDGVYFVKDGYGQPIYYRCPGYINTTSYDIGSVGGDGKIGADNADVTVKSGTGYVTNTNGFKTYFGKGDDITNCKR